MEGEIGRSISGRGLHTDCEAMHMASGDEERWIAGRSHEFLSIEVEDHSTGEDLHNLIVVLKHVISLIVVEMG
jgi:hypothetical protein